MGLFKNNFSPLMRLAIPLALTGLLQSGVFFFETLFLARLGPDVLAAGSLVSWLFGTFVVMIFGILSAISILVSHMHGQGDEAGIKQVVRDGFILSILLAIPSVLLFWNMSPLFLLVGQGAGIVAIAQSYLHALTWGLLPDFLMLALLEVIIGLGHARLILMFGILSVSLNIFFSFVLIFGKLGFPALGIAGAGWGMTISYWIMFAFLTAFVLIHKNYRRYFHPLFKLGKPSYVYELLRVGMPMGVMYCIEVGFFLAVTLIMGSFGSQLLAANQIALQYMGTLMAVIFSIAQAITVRMGHLLGAGDKKSAEEAAYVGIIISTLLMLLVAVFYLVFPQVLISIDFDVHSIENKTIVSFAVQFFAISAVFQVFEATRIALFGALRGLKDTHFTLLTSLVSFWGVALPVGYLLATTGKLGGAGLWWGMVFGAAFSVPLLVWRFKSKIKQYCQHDLPDKL